MGEATRELGLGAGEDPWASDCVPSTLVDEAAKMRSLALRYSASLSLSSFSCSSLERTFGP